MTVHTNRPLRITVIAVVFGVLGIVGTATAAGASTSCGQYSFGFEGTRLINDGISDTAGPFPIVLPAGSYDVTMRSHDAHDEHPGQTEQTQEQWYFTLDSGFMSAPSSDVPDEENTMVNTFPSVSISESTSITLHHLGQGGVNSVDPICVGFNPAVTPQPVVAPPAEAPLVEVPDARQPGVEINGPVQPAVKPEVKGVVEIRQAELIPPAALVKAPAPSVAPQLALTGPSAGMWVFALSGASLILLGSALVAQGRRRDDTTALLNRHC